jgi:hypothetical protein
MGRWLIAQGGYGKRPVSAASLATMHTPVTVANNSDYAMGWSRSRDGSGTERLEHSGNLFTYNAVEMLVPRTGYGIAAITNGAGLSDATYQTATGLLAMSEGHSPEPEGAPMRFIQPLLAVATAAFLALGVLGAVRARRWARRRAGRPAWRTTLRLIPAALPVAVFALYPSAISFLSAGRTVTWPQLTYFAAPVTIALGMAALAGLATTASRVTHLVRARTRPAPPPAAGAPAVPVLSNR